MTTVANIGLVLVGVAALLVAIRLAAGPAALDRVVALDALVTLIVVGAVLGTLARSDTTTGYVLVVLSLLGFVGSIASARLIERREDMR
ncbi:monovalent cation/H+ antiporter complex subunit F [Streptomyces sp. DSM 44915]|uniref:Monovalent cation/H+ antiporter complex subunit F n=1 Tax=Streptomyces chisholmiae TaxID=3075540 RepID=A0ABU2JTD4_9ACTN|nr:monovalent cation/H+ antiporter complex subunit F [Streptomyces sp. DSM 44915]MDT0267999.1 monovalent cation/H+ antiporter complex subunit F [Streptomyces sp. DSM 44915]